MLIIPKNIFNQIKNQMNQFIGSGTLPGLMLDLSLRGVIPISSPCGGL